MTREAGVIGVAGCGAMGLPMARRLHAAGFDTWGFDVRPRAEFGDFAMRMIEDAVEFAARCDTVISVVRDRAQTMDLCFDVQAVFARAAAPRRLVVCSTLSPRVLPELAARLPAGTELLDAPMSGAPYRAADGTLTFMVGGDPGEIARTRPLLEAMGDTIHHLGARGAGLTCKVVNNFVAASSVVVVRQALAAAASLGVPEATLLEVMRTSSGATWYGDNIEHIAWAREGYHAANTIGILEKDVGAFVDALGGMDPPRPLVTAVLAALRDLEPLSARRVDSAND